VLAPDLFATGMDWIMERTVGTAMNGVSFGPHSLSDLDFADDVALLAELIDLLVPALEMDGLTVCGQCDVIMTSEFVYIRVKSLLTRRSTSGAPT